ncbi:hypothetical protein I7I51_02102 [Histoplasma capsulatum]|uniref:Uncharacterized protein n=1 Tax=Ajellomyces capsulatus TaxID=5037 RepID=A0A8A1MK70_AJECA|nr:hypothetical protein I7I51_02102 [Histoplasma capsulatum]
MPGSQPLLARKKPRRASPHVQVKGRVAVWASHGSHHEDLSVPYEAQAVINPLIAHELGALLIIILILSANANSKRREEWGGVVLPRIDYQQSMEIKNWTEFVHAEVALGITDHLAPNSDPESPG